MFANLALIATGISLIRAAIAEIDDQISVLFMGMVIAFVIAHIAREWGIYREVQMREGQLYRLDFLAGLKEFARRNGDIIHYDVTARRGWRDGWHAAAEQAKRIREREKEQAQLPPRGIHRWKKERV